MENVNFRISDVVMNAYADVPWQVAQYVLSLLAFGVVVLLFYLIVESRGKRRSWRELTRLIFGKRVLQSASSKVDCYHFFAVYLIWTPLIAIVSTVIVGISLNDILIDEFGHRSPVLESRVAIIVIQFVAIYIGADFGFFAVHVLIHKIGFLWKLHLAHHSAEDLNIFTPGRFHPLEQLMIVLGMAIVGGVTIGITLYASGTELLPESQAALGVNLAISIFLTLFHHSNVWLRLGPLEYIIVGPVMHQIHHSAELRHRDKNFGATLMVFDWLFGTLYMPRERETYRCGLNDEELGERNPHNRLRDFYLEPLVSMWRALAQQVVQWFLKANPIAKRDGGRA